MSPHRSCAEQLRDALLAVSGKLDLAMGGPPAMQFNFSDPNKDVSPRIDYDGFDPDHSASYRTRRLSLPVPQRQRSLARRLRRSQSLAVDAAVKYRHDHAAAGVVALQQQVRAASVRAPGRTFGCEAPDLPVHHRAYRLLYARPPAPDQAALVADFGASMVLRTRVACS